MSDLQELRKKHEDLGRIIAEMEAKEKAKRPALAKGQLWRYNSPGGIFDGVVYIVYSMDNIGSPSLVLVSVLGGHLGESWADDGFGGYADKFEYLGMASDRLTIKGQA